MIRTPRATKYAITRNQIEPTSATKPVCVAALALNSESVTCPAGKDPATMKIVAETTRHQPVNQPRYGWSTRPTQA